MERDITYTHRRSDFTQDITVGGVWVASATCNHAGEEVADEVQYRAAVYETPAPCPICDDGSCAWCARGIAYDPPEPPPPPEPEDNNDKDNTPTEIGPHQLRYTRDPRFDKRIGRGDDYAGDAWRDQFGLVRWVVVGVDPNRAT